MATESAGTATSALSAWTTWLWTPSQVPTCQVPQPIFKSGTGKLSSRYMQVHSHRSLEYQRRQKFDNQSLLAFSPITTVYRDQRSEKQLAKVPRRVKVSLRLVPKNLNVKCSRTSRDAGSIQWVRSIMSDPCDPWHYDGWKLNKVWWIYPAASQL